MSARTFYLITVMTPIRSSHEQLTNEFSEMFSDPTWSPAGQVRTLVANGMLQATFIRNSASDLQVIGHPLNAENVAAQLIKELTPFVAAPCVGVKAVIDGLQNQLYSVDFGPSDQYVAQLTRDSDYCINVMVRTDSTAAQVADALQAVYDDPSRAPDGIFHVRVERGFAHIAFVRDSGADQAVLGCPLDEQNVVNQLAREFELQEGDDLVVGQLLKALKSEMYTVVFSPSQAYLDAVTIEAYRPTQSDEVRAVVFISDGAYVEHKSTHPMQITVVDKDDLQDDPEAFEPMSELTRGMSFN